MVEQRNEGYRFSIEPFLLANFANVSSGNQILDVGTGSGIIPILISRKKSELIITAVEIQKLLSDLALTNVQSAGLSSFIEVICGDYLEVSQKLQINSFDLILSNPPYTKLNSGRINPDQVKAIARHEIKLNLPNLVETSFRLLKPNGRIALSYPISRKSEVLEVLNRSKLVPTRLRSVYGRPGAIAKIFLVEAEKLRVGSSIEEDSIYIYKQDGSYSENMERIYASLDHPYRAHRVGQERDSSGVGQ
jgi:tRNA1Val (adenine37-N6)-methyltransferase